MVAAASHLTLTASWVPANEKRATRVRAGVTGELVSGNADVGLFPLTRTAARLEVIDCTFSYLDQGLTLLVK